VQPYGADFVVGHRAASAAREAVLDRWFTWCGGEPSCAFHGGSGADGVRSAWETVAAGLRTRPTPVGERVLTERDLVFGFHEALGDGGMISTFEALADAAARVETGDGSISLEYADGLYGREPEGYPAAAGHGITTSTLVRHTDQGCPAGFDRAAARATWTEILAESPHIGAIYPTVTLACITLPAQSRPSPIHAPRAPPLLLFGGANDPGSPLAGAQALVSALDNGSHLVEWQGYGHGYALSSSCVRASTLAFLLDPTTWVPPPGSVCSE
jgi:hypothetical protein